jgi:hypothetical protein
MTSERKERLHENKEEEEEKSKTRRALLQITP